MLPSDLKITCKSFGISSVHEIKFSPLDDNQLRWKKVSADTEYTNASFTKISSKNTGGKDNQVETTNQSQEAGILFTWKKKNSIWYLFNSYVFHVLHCVFLNKTFRVQFQRMLKKVIVENVAGLWSYTMKRSVQGKWSKLCLVKLR